MSSFRSFWQSGIYSTECVSMLGSVESDTSNVPTLEGESCRNPFRIPCVCLMLSRCKPTENDIATLAKLTHYGMVAVKLQPRPCERRYPCYVDPVPSVKVGHRAWTGIGEAIGGEAWCWRQSTDD